MSNFKELLLDVLNEQHKTFEDLENAGIIAKRVFYQYKNFTPFLPKVLEIANFLKISLDYLADRTTDNIFKKYKIPQTNFLDNLNRQLKIASTSKLKLSKDLHLGRANFTYWKNGSMPKFTTLIEIANYLSCTIDELLEHE
ncbi:MAG: helix-turn-helix transcriptional regulator [Clostridia bacterium]|nr:helix-turn-helix transcriptional regulator [Clostridia bacterium]